MLQLYTGFFRDINLAVLPLDIEIPKDAWTVQKKEKPAKKSDHEIRKNQRRKPPVASKLSGKCPNILVLHGWGQNGPMLEKTMKKMIKKFTDADTARLHFMSLCPTKFHSSRKLKLMAILQKLKIIPLKKTKGLGFYMNLWITRKFLKIFLTKQDHIQVRNMP